MEFHVDKMKMPRTYVDVCTPELPQKKVMKELLHEMIGTNTYWLSMFSNYRLQFDYSPAGRFIGGVLICQQLRHPIYLRSNAVA